LTSKNGILTLKKTV